MHTTIFISDKKEMRIFLVTFLMVLRIEAHSWVCMMSLSYGILNKNVNFFDSFVSFRGLVIKYSYVLLIFFYCHMSSHSFAEPKAYSVIRTTDMTANQSLKHAESSIFSILNCSWHQSL